MWGQIIIKVFYLYSEYVIVLNIEPKLKVMKNQLEESNLELYFIGLFML